MFKTGNDFTVQNGYGETKLLLGARNRPTALFAQSNTIALGAYKAIREAGLTIPDDISLIGFDNYMHMDFIDPPLARIAQPIDEMGVLAVKILIRHMENKEEPASQILLSPSLIAGKSVRIITEETTIPRP